jgi:asparagine synthase (glutamine-hydrolysing)
VDTKTIKIINDRMGLHPLYYAQTGKQFLFSSGIRALLVDQNISRSVDLTAISEIFTFDHILGQRTMLSNIKLMPQGSILTFSDGNLTIKPYHFFQLTQQHPLRTVDSYIEEYMMHMKKAIQRQYHGESGIGLMLSGGLDSRFILALMADISKHPLHTFSWSIPGSDDARFAKEAAKKAGTTHHFFELPPDWILEKGEKAIRLTDGNANIINLHAFANIEQESQITNTIFKGFLGDAMMGFGVRPRFWADYDEHTLMEVHLEAYRDYRVLTFDTPDHASVFTDSFYENTRESWFNDFKTGMLASKAKQMTDQRIYFDLTQRVPRMTINGVEVSRHRAQIRLPFADNDLLDFSLTLPPWLRLSRTLMNQAFIRYYPEYAKIPIAQTGLPMISCARELMLRNWQFIQWHLRNKGLHRLAGPQNRPYKDYTNWFRTNLRTWLENILLSERHLNRGYLKPQVIKNLVSEHMAGANHTSRLGAMLSVEIWHQQNID